VWDEAMKGLLAKGAAADGPEWGEWVAFWNGRAGDQTGEPGPQGPRVAGAVT
jgi:hypothetical protein